jgi:Amt family ammonium transporter
MLAAWFYLKKPDATMMLNGVLAGLVGVTAGCNNVSPLGAVVLGGIAGVIVVFSVLGIDRLGIDDPVGAISVHGVCGAWGTLAAGIFDTTGSASLGIQALGVAAAFLWTFPVMWLFFKLVAATMGLRVTPEEEVQGLDGHEHGNEAYASDAYSVHAGEAAA